MCERVFLLLVTHSAAITSFIYSNFHLLLFARVPLSFVGLFSPYVSANPTRMYADTHTHIFTPMACCFLSCTEEGGLCALRH